MKDNHIKRELYLKKIEDFIDTDFTKVLTEFDVVVKLQ